MPTSNISLPELFMLIAYMSFPVWCIARAIQWMQLKNLLTTPRLVLILLVSLIISFIITIVIWGGWPGSPMYSIICVPALVAEGFILLMTFMYKKSLVKKK
jgi:Trk-type K+ transport system membrane component